MRRFVAPLAALAVGVLIAAACNTVIELPPPRDHGGGTTTGPGSDIGLDDGGLPPDTIDFDASVLDTWIDDAGDDTNIDDTYDPETEYLDPPDCGRLDAEFDGASITDGGIPTGTRFCELFRDFLHVGGAAKCQTLHCHGGEDGMKHLSMGYDVDACYTAMTTHTATYFSPPKPLVRPVPGGDSRPYSALMQYIAVPAPPPAPPDSAFMPLTRDWLGNRKLTSDEAKRFYIWLARGAPND